MSTLLPRLRGDAAGVNDAQVGGFALPCGYQALFPQRPGDLLGFVLVDLATENLN